MSVLPNKPTDRPQWTENSPTQRIVPSPEFRENGWGVNVRPPFEFMNWILFNIGVEWLNYFDQSIEALANGGNEFDATIGTGGTDADINSFIARIKSSDGPQEDLRVLIFSPLTVTTTQVIDLPGIEFVFHKRALVAKGGNINVGIKVDASRTTLRGGRFLNFSNANGMAIELTENATNCRVIEGLFQNNTSDVSDNGASNTFINEQLI